MRSGRCALRWNIDIPTSTIRNQFPNSSVTDWKNPSWRTRKLFFRFPIIQWMPRINSDSGIRQHQLLKLISYDQFFRTYIIQSTRVDLVLPKKSGVRNLKEQNTLLMFSADKRSHERNQVCLLIACRWETVKTQPTVWSWMMLNMGKTTLFDIPTAVPHWRAQCLRRTVARPLLLCRSDPMWTVSKGVGSIRSPATKTKQVVPQLININMRGSVRTRNLDLRSNVHDLSWKVRNLRKKKILTETISTMQCSTARSQRTYAEHHPTGIQKWKKCRCFTVWKC